MAAPELPSSRLTKRRRRTSNTIALFHGQLLACLGLRIACPERGRECAEIVHRDVGDGQDIEIVLRPAERVNSVALHRRGRDRTALCGPDENIYDVLPALVDQCGHGAAVEAFEPA